MKVRIQVKGGTLVMDSPKIINRAKCRGCGKKIIWVKTMLNKAMPVSEQPNGEYISHFADCPKAKFFRKKKNESKRQNTSHSPSGAGENRQAIPNDSGVRNTGTENGDIRNS